MKRIAATAVSLALVLAAVPYPVWGQTGEAFRGRTPIDAPVAVVPAVVSLQTINYSVASTPFAFGSDFRYPHVAVTYQPIRWKVGAIPTAKTSRSIVGDLVTTSRSLETAPAYPEPVLNGLFSEGARAPATFEEGGAAGPDARRSLKSRGGLSRSVEGLKTFYRILPDPERNRAFWIFTLGQALVTLGFNFSYTALPGFIAPTKSENQQIGYNRAINWGSQAAGSVLTGGLVDRQPASRLLSLTYLGRGALMMLVPALFVSGHFAIGGFSLLIGLAGFLQSTSAASGSVAWNRILAGDEEFYNRANAVVTVVTNVVGVVGPLLAGSFLAWAGHYFADPLMGHALSFGIFGATMLATGVGYGLYLKISKDAVLLARKKLHLLLKADERVAFVKGVAARRLSDGSSALIVEVKGDPASAAGLPAQFDGYPVQVESPRHPLRELLEGFRLVFSNRFLRMWLLLSTLSLTSGDSLLFAAMPRFLADVLKAGPESFGIFLAAASLGLGIASAAMTFLKEPALGALTGISKNFRSELERRDETLSSGDLDRAATAVRTSLAQVLESYKEGWKSNVAQVRSATGLSEDVVAAATAALASALKISPEKAATLLDVSGTTLDLKIWTAAQGARFIESARRDARSGMDSLQRQGRGAYALRAISWLAYAGVFVMTSLWPSAGLVFLSALLAGPATIVWYSLETKVIAGTFPLDQGKVYSAINFYMLACMVVGVLGFGWLLAVIPTVTALWITGGVLVGCAVFDAVLSLKSFPMRRR